MSCPKIFWHRWKNNPVLPPVRSTPPYGCAAVHKGEKISLVGAKLKDYEDFKKAAVLVKSKAHLTLAGLEEIKNIKAGMNSLRK